MVPTLVTIKENASIIALLTFDEIRDMVFHMDKDSSLGPYGFSGLFFQKFWDIVGSNLVLAV